MHCEHNYLDQVSLFFFLEMHDEYRIEKTCASTLKISGELTTVKSRAVDRSTIQGSQVSGQRSQYIRIKFPLHKESENPWPCY